MKVPDNIRSNAIIGEAPISPELESVALLETLTVGALLEKEFDSIALMTEYSLVMEMNSSIYDSDDNAVTQLSESLRIADISNVLNDPWSMDEAIATNKLRLMFGSMQVQSS